MKISGRILGITLEWILILSILFVFLIRTSPVQTYLAKKATDYLSKELNVEVKIDKIDVLFPNEIALNGFLMKDEANDTLFAVKTLFATITDYNLADKKFEIGEVELNEGTIHLKRNQEGLFNYQFIKERFKSKKKKSNITLKVKKVILSETTFKYDDARYPKKDYGVDYFHLVGKKINAVVDDILIDNNEYSGTITSVSLVEKSGFILDKLNAQAKVSKDGVFLTDLHIITPGSIIYAPRFNMLSNEFPDFKQFVDKVQFDARINNSIVSLSEVAYFAPILKGMNDTVRFSSLVQKEVKNLRLKNIELKIRENTNFSGTINIPDYRDLKSGFYQEKIDYAYIDLAELQSIKMPDSYGSEYISIDKKIQKLGFFEVNHTSLDGFYSQFVIASKNINTNLGSVRMDNGIIFSHNERNNSFLFEKSSASEYDVKIENFDLGEFIGQNELGKVDGVFFLSGEAFSPSKIHFNSIEGDVNRFDYLGYAYNNINIIEGQLINNSFEGKIDVKDDNIALTYDGIVDFSKELHLDFSVIVQDALMDKLNFTKIPSSLSSALKIDLTGTNPNDFQGNIRMNSFSYKEGDKVVTLPSLNIDIDRGLKEDLFTLNSEIMDAELKGKFDYNNIIEDFKHNFSKIFPALEFKSGAKNNYVNHSTDNFHFNFNIKDPTNFLSIFLPELKVAPETTINGHFLENEANFLVDLKSDWIQYKTILFNNLDLHQVMDTTNIVAAYHINEVQIDDSVYFSDVYFKGRGNDDILNSNLSWGQHTINESSIIWETEISDWSHYDFILEPSYISIKELKWEVENLSNFSIANDTISVDDFIFSRGNQEIKINGSVSKNDNQHLNFDIKNVILDEISELLGGVNFSGDLNAKGYISNPYSNMQYVGEAKIKELFVKDQLVGDINLESTWIKNNESIALQGDLLYRDLQTFNFIGDYYPLRESENLDFNLFFNQTDIQFANAFFSPDLVSEIGGLLNGTIKVSGSPNEPELAGIVQLNGGSAKIEILGTSFGIEGPIEVDKYGFYINGLPIFDEIGNAGKIIGSVYHDNFADFNFDLLFDLEEDAINKDPDNPWVPLPLEEFLVLETEHVPGDPYYGTAYATGIVNIFGYTDNLEITVDLKSAKKTLINIPMYGVGEIDDENFIVFIDENKDTTEVAIDPKFDFTGVDLNLNFDINENAVIKLIFDEELGDIITAKGSGNIDIDVNNIGDITMNGIFSVKNGVYDFAMGPVRQKFYIEEGGTINWTGDPYDAILDLRTFYRVNANIAAITNNTLAQGSGSHQQVLCYLKLSESLTKPAIDFDIEAPNAGDIAQSVITRIKNDPDELNRQFFSLLLWRRFQPLAGSAEASGSAAIDLFTNQINALLSKISSDYQLNVDLNSDQLTGDNSYEFGLKKVFLDDRLIVGGSFGVENQQIDDNTDQSYFIGDVNLEYLLNESGTFRVNIFNESNDKTIIQNQKQGTFTQGAGLSYKEDFNKMEDFKAVQYFLDIFRKKKNKRYPVKRKKRQVLVPKEEG